ncbi:sugar-binding transcriptional regulator [Haloimpatiens sp. FM7330]|uniref:sugar-binding transcriptional regulator n=1 Tax=Haloimpatiens sp. FM7330 TaxID=3298610 RepID=UPI00363393B1
MQNDERQLLIDVSVMYYLEGMTQNEIAKKLFLSRPKVSRLLKKARELHIVDININYESDSLESLKNKIKNRFNVKNIEIVKTLSNYKDTLEEIGKTASKVLLSEIKEGMTVGISWGNTIRSTVSQMKNKKIDNVKIAELFGAFSYDMGDADMLSNATTLSSKIGGRLYPLPAPLYIEDPSTREILINNPVIKNSLNMIENCDLILTGLGSIDGNFNQPIWDIYVENDMKGKIKENGGIGFLCAHFFDENGEFLDIDINKNIIGIKTESIKNNKIMLVAGGKKKGKALHAILKGGYVDTLVTDEKTIKYVLELADKH